jgi:hypothetical protein
MKSIGLWLHYFSVATATLLLGVQILILPRRYTTDTEHAPVLWCCDIAALLAIYGFISGFILMARRKGDAESVLLAVTTIAAVVVLFFAGGAAF